MARVIPSSEVPSRTLINAVAAANRSGVVSAKGRRLKPMRGSQTVAYSLSSLAWLKVPLIPAETELVDAIWDGRYRAVRWLSARVGHRCCRCGVAVASKRADKFVPETEVESEFVLLTGNHPARTSHSRECGSHGIAQAATALAPRQRAPQKSTEVPVANPVAPATKKINQVSAIV